jgi:hypothetical protein
MIDMVAGTLLARHLQDVFGEAEGAAGALQERADDGAGENDDADVADGSAEAVVDRLDHVGERHAREDAKGKGGDQQRQERVHLQPGRGVNDEGDAREEQNHEEHGRVLP